MIRYRIVQVIWRGEVKYEVHIGWKRQWWLGWTWRPLQNNGAGSCAVPCKSSLNAFEVMRYETIPQATVAAKAYAGQNRASSGLIVDEGILRKTGKEEKP